MHRPNLKTGILVILASVLLIIFSVAILMDQSKEEISSAKKYNSISETPDQLRAKQFNKTRINRELGYAKSDQPGEYLKFHREIRMREGDDGPSYPPNYRLNELEKARLNAGERIQEALNWVERGPANVPGRTRGILIMPDDPDKNTWLAGSVGGGVWKTTDAGLNWELKTPDLPNLSTSVLAMSDSNPTVIYLGTGEGFGNLDAIIGDGIFKSVDGGDNWTQLGSTASNSDFFYVNRIIVDPASTDILVAATNTGIFRSIDGGTSWTMTYDAPGRVQDLDFSGSFSIQYAAVNDNGIVKSTDGGLTWNDSSSGIEPSFLSGRIEIAFSPSNSSVGYALAQGTVTGTGSDLYRTENSGLTWELVTSDDGNDIGYLAGQGWYDNIVAVSPFDPDRVYLGGVNVWKTEVSSTTQSTTLDSYTVNEIDSEDYFDFVNFGADQFNGALETGDLPSNEFVSVEIRWGASFTQKAHRFTVPPDGGSNGDGGAGVPDSDYSYQDYVDVPFEVWDIDNNKQLMVSFRDQEDNGVYNTNSREDSDDQLLNAREYLFVHAIDYDPSNPDPDVTVNGGHVVDNMYFMWPILVDGVKWEDPRPDMTIQIVFASNTLTTRLGAITNVTDAYLQFSENNSSFGEVHGEAYHPDQHNIIPIIVDDVAETYRIVTGTDGGLFISNTSTDPGVNDGDWTFTGNGFNTSQFYGADKKRGADEYIGGMQDNGTFRSPSGITSDATTDWLDQLGGDGFEVLWHYGDPNKIMGGSQFNGISRSLDGGETWQRTSPGSGPFVTRMANSNSNPDVVFAISAGGVFRSTEFGGGWDLIQIDTLWPGTNTSALNLEVSLSNFNIVWAGAGISDSRRLFVSVDNGETFEYTENYDLVEMGSISGIATHPYEDSTAYALFSIAESPKILKTTDLGQTWEDISGFGTNPTSSNGFPDVAVYHLLVRPDNPDILWAGTEIGIFESTDNGVSWHILDSSFPAVSTWQLKVVDDQIVVATHGRGIWSVTIPDTPEIGVTPFIAAFGENPKGELVIKAELRSSYDSTEVYVNGALVGNVGASVFGEATLRLGGLAYEDSLGVQIFSYFDGLALPSNTISTELFEPNPIATVYSTDFNDAPSADFIGDEDVYIITRFSGFNDFGINTRHPYKEADFFGLDSISWSYQLKTPIIIDEADAGFRYKDVAIVEPGEEGVPFGVQQFWDYVTVEGTTDGIHWKRIIDGYDANFDPTWLSTYNAGTDPDASMFVSHTIDLLETFNPGDTVFFRFRLFSDPLTAGYGWVIDDLDIQSFILGVEDDLAEGPGVNIYPNPVSPGHEVTLEFTLPGNSEVSIEVLNLRGQREQLIEAGRMAKGENRFRFTFSPDKLGLYFVKVNSRYGESTSRLILR